MNTLSWVALGIIVSFLISGCDVSKDEGKIVIQPQQEWEKAPTTHVCTEKEMERVHTETKWCIDNTSYFKSYCYGSAFIRNCKPKKENDVTGKP